MRDALFDDDLVSNASDIEDPEFRLRARWNQEMGCRPTEECQHSCTSLAVDTHMYSADAPSTQSVLLKQQKRTQSFYHIWTTPCSFLQLILEYLYT